MAMLTRVNHICASGGSWPGLLGDRSVGRRARQPRGHALAQERCAKCHAIEGSGASPYPGVQPFRNLDTRWTREHLAKALETGIVGENDQTGAIHEMRLTEAEIADLFAYLDTMKRYGE